MREFLIKDDNFIRIPLALTAERVVVFGSFAVFFILSAIFLFSDAPSLPYLGALTLLVVSDHFFHYFIPKKGIRSMPSKGAVNPADYISPKNWLTVRAIYGRSVEFGEDFSLNLMLHAMGDGRLKRAFRRLDVDADEFSEKILEKLHEGGESQGEKGDLKEDFLKIISRAAAEAARSGENEITVADLLLATTVEGGNEARKVFGIFGIDEHNLRSALIFSRIQRRFPVESVKKFAEWFVPRPQRLFGGDVVSRSIPALSGFAVNMTREALSGRIGFMVGHKNEYEELVKAMIRPEDAGAILLGKEGIGKGTLVDHLAHSITKDNVPKSLIGALVYHLDISRLLYGDEIAIARKTEEIFKELRDAHGVVIYISGASLMFDLPGGKFFSAAIETAAKSGKVRFVLAEDPGRWEIMKRAGWFKNFKVINIAEISEEESVEYLSYVSSLLERKWNIIIKVSAIARAVSLAKRYVSRPLPASAEMIIVAALEDAKIRNDKELDLPEVMAAALRVSKNFEESLRN